MGDGVFNTMQAFTDRYFQLGGSSGGDVQEGKVRNVFFFFFCFFHFIFGRVGCLSKFNGINSQL